MRSVVTAPPSRHTSRSSSPPQYRHRRSRELGGAGAPTLPARWCLHPRQRRAPTIEGDHDAPHRTARGSGTILTLSAGASRVLPPELFERRAAAAGVSVEQLLGHWPADVTLLGRLPTLAQVADAAVFLASDRAAAITGSVIDLTSGNAVRTAAGALVGVLD